MKKNMQGFTLIELMIVVAIIAILAAIAIAQYQDYVIRTQVSEGASLASGTKTAIGEYQNNIGGWPADNAGAGLAPPASISGNYVDTVTVAAGLVTAHFGTNAHAKIQGMELIVSPSDMGGSIQWTCKSDDIPQKWCATSCNCQ